MSQRDFVEIQKDPLSLVVQRNCGCPIPGSVPAVDGAKGRPLDLSLASKMDLRETPEHLGGKIMLRLLCLSLI